jgi:hypothetical protein
MMEAYTAVYAPQELTEEQIWEEVENWVNSLLEEGYDLSEYTWEEMYESYLNEMGQKPTTGQMTAPKAAPRPTSRPQVAGGGMAGMRGSGRDRNAYQTSSSPGALRVPASTAAATPARPAATPAKPAAATPAKPAAAPAKPAAAPAKPAAAAKAAPSNKTKDMDTWAKANPKLAAAAAEKARIRGTQQTDNPLMKSMRSRLPMNSPSVQSPEVAKLGAGNQSLKNNPNAFKGAKKPQAVNSSYEYDAYDLVLEYLFSEGHVDTLEEANYVMLEMDAEMIQSIIESYLIEEETPLQKIRRRNKEYFRNNPETVQKTTQRRTEHKSVRGEKKEKGAKSVFGTMRNIGGPYR